MPNLNTELTQLLGERGFLRGDALKDHPACAFVIPKGLIRPASTEELSKAMALCHQAGQAIVPQGGRTGVVGGTVARANEIVVSLERMNHVLDINTHSRTITAEAGAPLQVVQEAAESKQLMLPLDLGARGSATIGGNIATNAGGNRVLRYGMTREMVLGLEAVLADGTVISSMHQVIKNNTGYDLKQLFIGSEGTLGIVTRAVLRLRPQALSHNTALLATDNFDKLIQLLNLSDQKLGGSLSSFEAMWNGFYRQVTHQGERHRPPLSLESPYYVVIEAMGADPQTDDLRFAATMEALLEADLIDDAVIAQSERERESIWAVRDDIEALLPLYPFFSFDVSLPLEHMEGYVTEVQSHLTERWEDSTCLVFGHLGDGNIHLIVAVDGDNSEAREAVCDIVYNALSNRNGVISAEHGIGLEKKPYLQINRSEQEIALMRTLKYALDPKNILNPGKIFDSGPKRLGE